MIAELLVLYLEIMSVDKLPENKLKGNIAHASD
jgi:hypothetical protein